MFRNKFLKGCTPIGIDIRDMAVHAMQFIETKEGIRLHASATEPVSESRASGMRTPALLDALKALRAGGRFKGRKAVTAMSCGHVDIRPLHLPMGVEPDDSEGFYKALRHEARSVLPYSPDLAQLDYLPLGHEVVDGKPRFALLLVAARMEKVNRHLAILSSAGFECMHMEASAYSSLRILKEPETTYVVVEIDQDAMVVSVAREGKLLFSRTVPFGLAGVKKQLASAVGLKLREADMILQLYGIDHTQTTPYDLADTRMRGLVSRDFLPGTLFDACASAFEHMAQEIKRSIDYYQRLRRGSAGEKAYICGSGLPAGTERFLEARMGLPIHVVDSLGLLARHDARFSDEQAVGGQSRVMQPFATASGLALRGIV